MKVILIAAMTLCGRIGPVGTGSSLDRQHLERFRALTDGSLIGARTLRDGDPELRGPQGRLDPGRLRAVITASGDIFGTGKLFQQGPAPVVFTSVEQVSSLTARLKGRARVIGLPTGPAGLSVAAAVRELETLGARSVLIEGGGRLNYAALREDVVDEFQITVTPFLSGDRTAANLADGNTPLGAPFAPLTLVSAETASTGELFLCYRRGKKDG